jgi:isopentenyl-diphosphate delta-isomerase
MREEFFDVVDANDAVIGRALRKDVHARGLWHRAVHVLVFNAAGETFLQKRSMSKDMSPGCWDAACSGHVDSGEDYDTAAARELGEEIGVHVTSAELVRWQRVEACAQTGWEFLWVYRLRHEGPFVLHPEEIERGDWIAPAALTAWMGEKPSEFTPAFRLIWERFGAEASGQGRPPLR